MNRLTEKDDQGNWHLKGVRWEQLNEGQVITGELREKLYGALWKLMEYEDTGMDPEEVEELLNFEKTDSYNLRMQYRLGRTIGTDGSLRDTKIGIIQM